MAQARFYSSVAAKTTSVGTINASVTTLVVAAATGFPASLPFTLILERDTANEEVVTVTAVSGTTLTVSRAQDGTTGVTHATGAVVEHGVSARDFSEPQAHIAASSAVHGITGSVVGTTDTQTLAGKTLTTPVIADFSNAGHSHHATASGGQLAQADTHGTPDTDASSAALHHTIGVGSNQAAAGNHNHSGVYSATGHGHAESDVTSLVADLASKAANGHSHAESDVTSLVGDLAGKAASGHTHAISTDSGWARGSTGITTNGSGQATITHSLGSTPTVLASLLASGSDAVCTVFNVTSTQFSVQIFHADTAATWNAAGFTVNWVAFA